MPEIKRTPHFQRLSCLSLLTIIPGMAAIYYGNALSRSHHDQTWQLLGVAGFATFQIMPWLIKRAQKHFKCPQCQTLLTRDDLATVPKADAKNLKFTCAKCDVTWDASIQKVEPPRRKAASDVPGEPEGLIAMLLDHRAPFPERDDAATCLGDFDEPKACEALLSVASDPREDSALQESCGESLAQICNRRPAPNAPWVNQLCPAARQIFDATLKPREAPP